VLSAQALTSARIVALIPARYSSTRLPGKPLADIGGKPMIEHVYRRAAAAPSIAAVVVATDDERIVQAVEAFGGTARLTRPSHPSGSDRLAEVAETLRADLIVNVQGDEPLIEPAMIEEALAPLAADPSLLMGTLRRRIDDPSALSDPNVVKVVVDREGYALYFSRAPIPFVRGSASTTASGDASAVASGPGASPTTGLTAAYKHIGLYVYRRDFLLAFSKLEPTPLERLEALEQLRALEHGIPIITVETRYDSIGVDTPEDLDRVRRLMAAKNGP
jgi:3-deoxy-manno-octulosonate cytidylyltransferase (CMP-KDO synthetase)